MRDWRYCNATGRLRPSDPSLRGFTEQQYCAGAPALASGSCTTPGCCYWQAHEARKRLSAWQWQPWVNGVQMRYFTHRDVARCLRSRWVLFAGDSAGARLTRRTRRGTRSLASRSCCSTTSARRRRRPGRARLRPCAASTASASLPRASLPAVSRSPLSASQPLAECLSSRSIALAMSSSTAYRVYCLYSLPLLCMVVLVNSSTRL